MIHLHAQENTPLIKLYVLKKKINSNHERNYKYSKFFDDRFMFDGSDQTSQENIFPGMPSIFDLNDYWVLTNINDKITSVRTKNSIKGGSSVGATISIKNALKYFNLTREGDSAQSEYITPVDAENASLLENKYIGKSYRSNTSLAKSVADLSKVGVWEYITYEIETAFFTNDVVVIKEFSKYKYENTSWTILEDCYKTIFVGLINTVANTGEGQSFEISLDCEGLSKKLRADVFTQFRSVADLIEQSGEAKEDYRTSGVASPFSNLTVTQLLCELLLSYFYLDTRRKPFNFLSKESIVSEAEGLKRNVTDINYIDLFVDRANTKKFAEIKNINTRAFDYINLNDFKNFFFNEYKKPIDLVNDMVNKFFHFFYQDDDGLLHFDDVNHDIANIAEEEELYKIDSELIYGFGISQDDSTILTRLRVVPSYQFAIDEALIQLETREDIILDAEEKFGIRDYEVKTVRGVTSVKEIFNFARSFLLRNNSQYESLSIRKYNEPMVQINNNILFSDFMTIYLITGISRDITCDSGSNIMTLEVTWARKPLNKIQLDKILTSHQIESINANIDLNTRTYKFNFYDQYANTEDSEKIVYGLYWQIIPRLEYVEGRIPSA